MKSPFGLNSLLLTVSSEARKQLINHRCYGFVKARDYQLNTAECQLSLYHIFLLLVVLIGKNEFF
jgi:hypothetical protein